MTARSIVWRSVRHYRRTNAAVVAGVACAVAVLAGALLVGESVRASLRAIADARLGRTDLVVTSETFFREALCTDLIARKSSTAPLCAPLVVSEAVVTHEPSGRRAAKVSLYGVDDRFFAFHGVAARTPGSGSVHLSPALARELGAASGDSLVIRVARPSDIPLETLHGRRDEGGRAIRAAAGESLDAAAMGEFSVAPVQGAHHAVFLPLSRLQRDLDVPDRVNAMLVADDASGSIAGEIRRAAAPEDLGLHVRAIDPDVVAVESDAGLIPDALAADIAAAAGKHGFRTTPVLTYLANQTKAADRTVPYSLITALDPSSLEPGVLREGLESSVENPIVLNDWAARDLNVKPGDRIAITYYRWLDAGRLATETAAFTLAAITPIEGVAADRRLAPDYPGISDTDSLSDWDPPFPVDLSLVRQIDEDYWDRYRTTPKAFIPIESGRRLWQSRWGTATSLRLAGARTAPRQDAATLTAALRASLDPAAHGLRIINIRQESADAAQGSADFGQYFLGFSFFLVVSALLLAGLFFRLGVEQRLREIGLLTAVGFTRGAIRRLFVAEGLILAVAGSALGLLGAVGYAAIVLHGLRTWWNSAVNTTALDLHVSAAPLITGAVAGIVTAWVCIALSIRGLRKLSPRSLLSGHAIDPYADRRRARRGLSVVAITSALGGITLVALGFVNVIPKAGAFFGGGMLLLVAALTAFNLLLRSRASVGLAGEGNGAYARLGLRNASWRPGRSVLSASLVAAAVFLIVSVDAFRRGGDEALEPDGGAGGFAIVGESVVPIVHDLNTPEGREEAGLILDEAVSSTLTFHQLRLRPGDDTSCVNLYKPKRPRIVGVTDAFIDANRFSFASSATDAPNPWTALRSSSPGEPYPAIADATSLQYVLHAAVGDELVIDEDSARPLRIRIVGALSHSALQGELLVSEASFKQMFPDEAGFRMMLVDVRGDRSPARLQEVAGMLEGGLDQSGLDAQLMSDRLEAFNRVENTYLSTFQSLGALGLLLGTFGLATVLARNVLERRRELALLRAVGYRASAINAVVLFEHVALLLAGMAAGAVTAAIAIVPGLSERGFAGGWTLPAWLAAIFTIGALVTLAASRLALKRPLLQELRSE